MKVLGILLLCLLSNDLFAGLHYKITINAQGYELFIRMIFDHKGSLPKIRSAFTNPKILTTLSPNVKSIDFFSFSESEYESVMKVSSYGFSSHLPSRCIEAWTETTWSRTCKLETDKMDGGKYMEWKNDHVICQENAENVKCEFAIKGKARPLSLGGVELLDHRQFSVKAKAQAMHNFFKQYVFLRDYGLSLKRTLSSYKGSSLEMAVSTFEEKAKETLKEKISCTEEKSFED